MEHQTPSAATAHQPQSFTVQHVAADGRRRLREFKYTREGNLKPFILGWVIRDFLRRHPDSPFGLGLSVSPVEDLATQVDLLLEVDDDAWKSEHLHPTTGWYWTSVNA